MPKPRPILYCRNCGHDLSAFIETPWIRTCPECGKKFDPDFIYEGNARNSPEPNFPPPRPPPHVPSPKRPPDAENPH